MIRLIRILTLGKPKRLSVLLTGWVLVACQPKSEELIGSYEATVSSTNGEGRVIELLLNDDQTTTLTTTYMNSRTPIVQRGTWLMHGQDSMTMFLIEKNGSLELDTLGLKIDRGQLEVIDNSPERENIKLMSRIP